MRARETCDQMAGGQRLGESPARGLAPRGRQLAALPFEGAYVRRYLDQGLLVRQRRGRVVPERGAVESELDERRHVREFGRWGRGVESLDDAAARERPGDPQAVGAVAVQKTGRVLAVEVD